MAAGEGEILRVVVPALPVQFDPQKAATAQDVAVAGEVFLGLATYDALGKLAPGAATSWQVSADGLTYVFTLRDDLTWSDGTRLTAADFVAGLNRGRDPAIAPFAGDLAAIASLDAPNGHTVTIILKQRSAAFLDALSQPVAAPRQHNGPPEDVPSPTVGNGPFTAQVDAGGVRLMANPHFTAFSRGNLAGVTFLAAPTAENAATLVREGTADLALGFTLDVPPGRTPPRPFKADPGHTLAFVAVNTTHKSLAIREVRHALAMVIDREGILKTLRLIEPGSPPPYVPAYTMVPPPVYGGGLHGRAPYAALRPDMRTAIAEVLLLERGIDPAHPVTMDFVYARGTAAAVIVKSLSDVWAKLGVRLNLLEKSAADYERALQDGAFDLALCAWPAGGVDPMAYLAPLMPSAGPRNVGKYAEPDFAQRMADADAEIDPAQRMNMLSDAETVLIQDQAILPVFFFPPSRAVGGAVENWQANPRGYHAFRFLSR